MSGGSDNSASREGSCVAGGQGNTASGALGAIGGGTNNVASGAISVISGGKGNTADSEYTTVGGGIQNTASGTRATVGGGYYNTASGARATVPGGEYNNATGNYSFAAGLKAKAKHDGSFVWADSENADFSSTTNDQFAVKADGGLWLSEDAGTSKTIHMGERFRDNSIIAWARIPAGGGIGEDFGIQSVTKTNTGVYNIVLDAESAAATNPGEKLIAIAVAEVDSPPTNATALRICSVNQDWSSNRFFQVFINNGAGAQTDSDFLFMVTGR